MSTLQEIQAWFQSHCDGDWEHGEGIRISSLDNPGWAIDIDLHGTELAAKPHEPVDVERNELEWLRSWTQDGKFLVRCGPGDLEKGLRSFLDWAGS